MSVVNLNLDLPDFGARALCADADPDMFFPGRGSNGTAAKRLCARCDARNACLEWSLPVLVDGIWGGTHPGDRERIRKARSIRPRPLTIRPFGHHLHTLISEMHARGIPAQTIAAHLEAPIQAVYQHISAINQESV